MFFEAISASLLVLIVNLIDLFTVSVAILVEGNHGKNSRLDIVKFSVQYISNKQLTIIPRVRMGSESIAHEFSEIA